MIGHLREDRLAGPLMQLANYVAELGTIERLPIIDPALLDEALRMIISLGVVIPPWKGGPALVSPQEGA